MTEDSDIIYANLMTNCCLPNFASNIEVATTKFLSEYFFTRDSDLVKKYYDDIEADLAEFQDFVTKHSPNAVSSNARKAVRMIIDALDEVMHYEELCAVDDRFTFPYIYLKLIDTNTESK